MLCVRKFWHLPLAILDSRQLMKVKGEEILLHDTKGLVSVRKLAKQELNLDIMEI